MEEKNNLSVNMHKACVTEAGSFDSMQTRVKELEESLKINEEYISELRESIYGGKEIERLKGLIKEAWDRGGESADKGFIRGVFEKDWEEWAKENNIL